MTISIIVAASTNDVIGARGSLPWYLPDDLKRFKRLTMGKPMVMGRLTFESIGRALPGRRSIVLTRSTDYSAIGAEIARTPQAALELAGDVDEVMVIGGRTVYEVMLPMTGRIYLTRVHAVVDGDVFFPKLNRTQWTTTSSERVAAAALASFDVTYEILERQ